MFLIVFRGKIRPLLPKSDNYGTCLKIGQLGFIPIFFIERSITRLTCLKELKRDVRGCTLLVRYFSGTFWPKGVEWCIKVDSLVIFRRSGRIRPATDSRYVVVQLNVITYIDKWREWRRMMYYSRYFAYISSKWSSMTSHGQSICGHTTKSDIWYW